jgi:hypothetical protein
MKNSISSRWPTCGLVCLLVLTLAHVGSVSLAAQADVRPIGVHVVRPGDTLEGLSRIYSGDAGLWRENWALNPDIQNPNRLEPGQRVRILLEQDVPPSSARIFKVWRQVEKKPSPQPWDRAEVNDMLRDRDGIRTGRDGSTEMGFTDGTALTVTEGALVFLRQFGNRLQGVARDEIEIVEGQADLSGRQVTAPSDIDIVIGTARATPKPDEDGTLQTRLRKADRGSAQLMVYEGASAIESAGASVAVAAGMGTSVEEGKPPAPPEKLLPAPETLRPEAGSRWGFSNPELAWGAVEGAASYRVEVCGTPDCVEAYVRQNGLRDTAWRPERLPAGDLHWRVTAVAASGLDGYPSAPVAFRIDSEAPDMEAPAAQIGISGRFVGYGEALVLGPFSRFETQVADMQSGVGEWQYLLDGEAVSREAWSGPWKAGPHSAAVIVADRAGNHTQLGPIEFVADPTPPQLDWRTGGPRLIADNGLAGWQGEPLGKRRAKQLRRAGVILEYSSDGARWLPVRLPVDSQGRWRGKEERVQVGTVKADRARLFLRAPIANPFASSSPIQLTTGEILEVSAEDPGSGVEALTFGVTKAGDDFRLWFEATDLVGNSQTLEVPIRPLR